MPKAFDDMVSEIKKSLKKQYPNLSDKEIESKAYAMATSVYKKKYGKAPSESLLLEYSVPITFTENISESTDFIIRGIAISETTTLNNHKYIAEELEKASATLMNKPLLVDHDQKVENIKGKIISSVWNPIEKRIDFEAKVTDESIKKLIKEGVLSTVSIGAYAKELVEDKDGSMIAKGLGFAELSFVPCPADANATFVMAMQKLHESSSIQDELKGGNMEITETDNSVKVIAELQEKIKAYQLKERQSLEQSYKEMCSKKLVQPVECLKLSDETITTLIEQLNSVKITEKEEIKEIKDDGFMIERTSKGFALFKK